jgi:peptide/nickel transport system permease protein
MLGVLALTFLLFRAAAGDPAAAALGKNPSPAEVEELRLELGVDKPLLWGSMRGTEAFGSADFRAGKNTRGWRISGDNEITDDFLLLKNGASASVSKNFGPQSAKMLAAVTFQGELQAAGRVFSSRTPVKTEIVFDGSAPDFTLSAPENGGLRLFAVEFFQDSGRPWDSQMISALSEIVTLKPGFPGVSFFNFGNSVATREPVREVIARGVLPSLLIMGPVFLAEMVVGIALALIAAAFRGGWPDRALLAASTAGMSVSFLVIIIAGQWFLGYQLNLFPVWGFNGLAWLALPVIIGTVSGLGEGVRFYRTVFVSELNREHLRTAVAKGCAPLKVYTKHLLSNALIPIIARAANTLPFLFTGSLLLETFFGIPGLGWAGVSALMNADLQMLKALVIAGAFIFVVVNLLADVAYAWADPRIRLE